LIWHGVTRIFSRGHPVEGAMKIEGDPKALRVLPSASLKTTKGAVDERLLRPVFAEALKQGEVVRLRLGLAAASSAISSIHH